MPDKSKWPHVEANEILPPIIQRPPDRPKTCRRREVDEPLVHTRRFAICCSYYRGKKTKRILVSLKLLTI